MAAADLLYEVMSIMVKKGSLSHLGGSVAESEEL